MSKYSIANLGPPTDAETIESLSLAVAILETSMTQILIYAAALQSGNAEVAPIVGPEMSEDLHNEIDLARERVADTVGRLEQARTKKAA
jgi:hypothetical protein